jgi:hypothetical protein
MDTKQLKDFNLGPFKGSYLEGEIESGVYDSVKEIKENDIVVDIGASTGIVSWFAKDMKPKHIYMYEPFPSHIQIIKENFSGQDNWTLIEKAVSNVSGQHQISWEGNPIVESTTFAEIAKQHPRIDFLKIDIEGDEYHVFTEENLNYLNNHTGIIVAEFHMNKVGLNYINDKERFRNFRDNVLPKINKQITVNSTDMADIKWDLHNEHFLEYYTCVIFTFRPSALLES